MKTGMMSHETKHHVVLILSSTGDDPHVDMAITYGPAETGISIKELGYLPASYKMLEQYLVPALEDAYIDQFPELKE